MDEWPVLSKYPLPEDLEVFSAVMPMQPSTTLFGDDGEVRALTHSPAWSFKNLPSDGVSPETVEFVSRWPFRLGVSGKDVPEGWTSLTVVGWEMAAQEGEQFESRHVDLAARALIELEQAGAMVWDSHANLMLMNADVAATTGGDSL